MEQGGRANYSILNREVYIAAWTADGPLHREIKRYLGDQPKRRNVTWDQLKQHIQHSFLSPHEADKLWDEVQNVKKMHIRKPPASTGGLCMCQTWDTFQLIKIQTNLEGCISEGFERPEAGETAGKRRVAWCLHGGNYTGGAV